MRGKPLSRKECGKGSRGAKGPRPQEKRFDINGARRIHAYYDRIRNSIVSKCSFIKLDHNLFTAWYCILIYSKIIKKLAFFKRIYIFKNKIS